MGQIAPDLGRRGVGVAGIAVTATFSQLAFARHLGVDFPLLSDWERGTCAAYGVRYDAWKGHSGLAKRSLFVVDREQMIRYAWVTDDALVVPDLAPALSVIDELLDA